MSWMIFSASSLISSSSKGQKRGFCGTIELHGFLHLLLQEVLFLHLHLELHGDLLDVFDVHLVSRDFKDLVHVVHDPAEDVCRLGLLEPGIR
jgi:hypothetical protein